jgi:WD40 repeat protein
MDAVSADEVEHDERRSAVLASCLEALDRDPQTDLQTLLGCHPEFATELREFLSDRAELHRMAGPLRALAQAAATFDPSAAPRVVGDYELLEELGRGGMGVVYRARQHRPGRVVALKMIRAGSLASAAEVRRFRNEAEAAAGLDHPHIVPIYEVGDQEGQLFFSMRFLEGGSLADRLGLGTDRAHPLPPRDAARLLITVAQAVHHAHQRGVLHRDLKPSNILLDAAGGPHVADFGLAKQLNSDGDLTQSGTLLGTPGYMAPEQAAPMPAPGRRGGGDERLRATTALDVYGLGTILYALLTGRAPFQGDTPLDTLDRVRSSEPVPPRRIRDEVDRDLEAVCLKCLEKEPARRYGSAEALAEDLERWLAGKPTCARTIGPLGRVLRWCRRKPLAMALIVLSVALLAGSTTALVVGLVSMARSHAAGQEREAAQRRQHYPTDMRSANEYLLHGDFDKAAEILARYEPRSDEEDLHGFEWGYLKGLADALPRERVCYRGHRCDVMCAIFTPDGRSVVSGDGNGDIHFWDARSGACHAAWRAHGHDVNGLSFSPDGGTLASGGGDGTVRLWDMATGKQRDKPLGVDGEVERICLSPNGRSLVAPSSKGRIYVWDVATGVLKFSRQAHTDRVYTTVFSPDGRRIASASLDNHVKVWDAQDGRLILEKKTGTALYDVCFSPDGTRLAAGDGKGVVHEWDVSSAVEIPSLELHARPIRAQSYSADGSQLASGGDDRALRILDTQTRRFLTRADAHSACITAVAYSPDGSVLVSASRDHTVRIWDLGRPPIRRLDGTVPKSNTRAQFSPDGRLLSTCTPGSELIHWDRITLQKRVRLSLGPKQGHLVTYAPDSRSLALSNAVGDLFIQGLDDEGRSLHCYCLANHPVPLSEEDGMEYAPDGQLYVWLESGRSYAYPSQQKQWQSAWWHPSGLRRIAPSPDGQTLALGTGREVRFWNRNRQDREREECILTSDLRCLTYSPNGQHIAVACADGRILLLDEFTRQVSTFLSTHKEELSCVVFSPDSRTLVTGSLAGTVRLWHVPTPQELFVLEDREGHAIRSVAFSPDGGILVTAGDPVDGGRNVTLWYGDCGTDEREGRKQ